MTCFEVFGNDSSVLECLKDARRCWNIAGSETPLLPRRGLSMSVSQSNKNSSQSYKNSSHCNKNSSHFDKSETPEKLRETTKHRLKLEKIGLARKLAAFEPKVALRVASCGTYLQFSVYENTSHDHCRLLNYADFCGKRKFCPQCAAIYSQEKMIDFLGRFHHLNEAQKKQHLPLYRLIFLTLTVKNCLLEELRETVKAMVAAWRRLMQTKRFRQAVPGGWFRNLEYRGDETRAGWAHPHFHILLIVASSYFRDDYIKNEEWSAMWRDALRVDYDPVCWVERVKPRKRKDGKQQSASAAAAAEVCKYPMKPADVQKMSGDDFRTLYYQTKGIRDYAIGGAVKDMPPDPPEELDPAVWSYLGEEIWRWGMGQYVMTSFAEAKPR